jgi:CyaY protein
MEESEFNQCVDDTLYNIEGVIEESGLDIDYDTIAGILTLEFDDQSKIIINRQSALSQLWIAARSGGFHLDYIDNQWYCQREQCWLGPLLDRLCSEQTQSQVRLEL